jgi:hypothetical protein
MIRGIEKLIQFRRQQRTKSNGRRSCRSRSAQLYLQTQFGLIPFQVTVQTRAPDAQHSRSP